MKKTLLSILLLSSTLLAREPDEMELTLMERAKWCHEQGEKHPPQLALEWFNLEQKYLSDLRWHRFIEELKESFHEDDEDDEPPVKVVDLLKRLS